MADKLTVEQAAELVGLAPPRDPELRAYLLRLVSEALAEKGEAQLRAEKGMFRETWRLFVDPDALFIAPFPPSDVVGG